MKNILKYSITYIFIVIIFLSALLLVSFIPNDLIKDNTKKSALTMIKEGETMSFKSLFRTVFEHNSTDAIMLNLSYTIDEENKLESVIKARRNYVPGVTKNVEKDIIGNLPHEYEKFLMTQELLNTLNGNEQTSYEYTRYWHGYIAIFRILLIFFDITAIRWILQIALIIFIGILAYYLRKNSKSKIALSVIIAFIATDIFVWFRTLQGMLVMIVAVLISIFIANKKINSKNINFWLFISGALTAYFDFLTTPLVSILLPMMIYTAVNHDETTLKNEIIRIIKNCIAWGIGYLGVWATKWLIADILYNMEIIKTSVWQIIYRMGGAREEKIENLALYSLMRNLLLAMNFVVIGIYAFVYIYGMAKVGSYKKGYFFSSEKLTYYFCYIIPILWFIIISDHSSQHFFFTYKNVLISHLALLLIVLDDRNGKYIIEKGNKK